MCPFINSYKNHYTEKTQKCNKNHIITIHNNDKEIKCTYRIKLQEHCAMKCSKIHEKKEVLSCRLQTCAWNIEKIQ